MVNKRVSDLSLNVKLKGGYMKKNTKKILALSVLGMFMLMFAMQFVAADAATDAIAKLKNPIGTWFPSWEDTDISPHIMKYFFWGLVSMIVWSVASKIPGLDGLFNKEGTKWLGALFSIVIGFVSMAYITPDEVYVMMTSYSALGFVLGGALPFIILLYFTVSLAAGSTKDSAKIRFGKKSMAVAMWVMFTLFIGYRALFGGELANSVAGYRTLTWMLFVACVIGLFLMGWVFRTARKVMEKEEDETVDSVVKKSTKMMLEEAKKHDDLSEGTVHKKS